MKIKTLFQPLSVILFLLSVMACSNPAGGPGPDYKTDEEDADEGVEVDESLSAEAGVKRIIYHVGPVDLPAGQLADVMAEDPMTMRFQMDEDLWVMGFEPKVVDVNGRELPPELLQFAVVSNLHEENPFCSGSPGGNPFFVAGPLLTSAELPQGFGYPLLAKDPIEVKTMLANPTPDNYSGVFFEFTLVARPVNGQVELADVQPVLFELDPCTHGHVKVEPRSLLEKSATYTINADADLVMAVGVLGDYSSSIALSAKNETSPFWKASARLDSMHKLVEIDGNPFEDPAGVPLKSGDAVTFSVAYDNSSDKWLKHASAAAVAYVAPK